MNLGFMQQLQQRKNQGENLGSAEALLQNAPGAQLAAGLNIESETAGLVPTSETLPQNAAGPIKKIDKPEVQPQEGELTLGQTFANEVIRRMGETTGEDGEPKDSTDLRHSLGQTMDWMRERFGDKTAAAAAGMILQSTSGGVTEDSLGDGLLNTVRAIDRNFGFAAGDAVMAKFNSGVNAELNEYFDNGKNEIFHVATSAPQPGTPSATQDLSARLFMRAVQESEGDEKETENLTEKLLKDLKAELDKTAELQDLTTQLEDKFNPAKATPQAVAAAYEAVPQAMEPQFASMTV